MMAGGSIQCGRRNAPIAAFPTEPGLWPASFFKRKRQMIINIDKYRYHSRKKNKFGKRRIILFLGLFGLISLTVLFVVLILPSISQGFLTTKSADVDIVELWNSGLYDEVVNVCQRGLVKNPMDRELLRFHGFAKYYKAFFEKAHRNLGVES